METNVLKLRVLLAFLKGDQEVCTVTGIAKTLGQEKYTISRIITGLEKEGLINRDNVRCPVLTPKGMEEANRYAERIEVTLNHLIYEGVDLENAKRDSYYWALYNTEQTMEVLRNAEEQYRVKYELRNQKKFGGKTLCERMKDGYYNFPFLMYREYVKDGSNLSMGNEAFEHPCTLYVKNGVGVIQLKALEMVKRSMADGTELRGRVKSLKYFDGNTFVGADSNGSFLSFPASVLSFVNIGSGIGQILHGSVCVKAISTVGANHMPESMAIFTIII